MVLAAELWNLQLCSSLLDSIRAKLVPDVPAVAWQEQLSEESKEAHSRAEASDGASSLSGKRGSPE